MRTLPRPIAIALAVLLGLIASSSATATGLGANFTYGLADGNVSDFAGRIDFASDDYTFGFTMDTAVARNRLLNYRLDVNYERSHFEPQIFGLSPVTFYGNGGSLNNALGFGVVRTRHVRLWLGPTLRIGGAYYGEIADFGTAEFGGGVDLGVNVHTGDLLSICATLGYQYVFTYLTETDDPDLRQDFTGGANRFKAGVTILFRLPGDQFQ